jgi:hypothetical protein
MSTPLETWTAPTGQEFRGTPEYIVGVKAGWDAARHRYKVRPVDPSHEHHHPNDTSTQREGEVW